MVRDGEAITVPLHLPDAAVVKIEGWLLGSARRGAEIELRWDGGEASTLPVRGDTPDGQLRVPDVPGAGKHRLTIAMKGRPHGAVVLDRLVVETGR